MGLKNVQISEELFFALLKYHLVEMDDVKITKMLYLFYVDLEG